jgi:hypothetical protein
MGKPARLIVPMPDGTRKVYVIRRPSITTDTLAFMTTITMRGELDDIYQTTGKSGRPRGSAPRCNCGEMTVECAIARAHKC